jgi:hypothetical protein
VNGEYLGDGVYIEHDGFGVWLRAPREEGVHKVYLEREVFHALCAYWRRHFGGDQSEATT